MDIKKVLLTLILIVGITNIIIFTPLLAYSFDKEFYKSEFETYNIYERFQNEPEVIDLEFGKVIDYVNSDSKKIDSTFFNKNEKTHLKDVREIFNFIKTQIIIYFILSSLIIYYLIYSKQEKELVKGLKLSSYFSFGILGIIITGILINFKQTFILMHKLIFTNKLWFMNYKTDLLIRMMPNELFFDMGLKIIITSLILTIFIYGVSYYLTRKIKNYTVK